MRVLSNWNDRLIIGSRRRLIFVWSSFTSTGSDTI